MSAPSALAACVPPGSSENITTVGAWVRVSATIGMFQFEARIALVAWHQSRRVLAGAERSRVVVCVAAKGAPGKLVRSTGRAGMSGSAGPRARQEPALAKACVPLRWAPRYLLAIF